MGVETRRGGVTRWNQKQGGGDWRRVYGSGVGVQSKAKKSRDSCGNTQTAIKIHNQLCFHPSGNTRTNMTRLNYARNIARPPSLAPAGQITRSTFCRPLIICTAVPITCGIQTWRLTPPRPRGACRTPRCAAAAAGRGEAWHARSPRRPRRKGGTTAPPQEARAPLRARHPVFRSECACGVSWRCG